MRRRRLIGGGELMLGIFILDLHLSPTSSNGWPNLPQWTFKSKFSLKSEEIGSQVQ